MNIVLTKDFALTVEVPDNSWSQIDGILTKILILVAESSGVMMDQVRMYQYIR